MELKTLTWSDFDHHGPCYSPAERYGEWSGNILELLQRDDIPAKDRIWAATREGILDDKTLRLFACKCAREVWHLLTDERSRKVVETSERYAVGEATEQELAAAREAAWVAWRVSNDAASTAASTAAWSAASTAWGRASGAAYDASETASDASPARDAALEKQIEILIELIKH